MRKFLVAASLALGLVLSQASAKPVLVGKTGGFEFYTDSDPLTDDDRSFIAVDALEGNSYLAWKCSDNLLNIFLRPNDQYYDSDEDYTVTLRFDKNKAVDLEGWSASVEKKAIFMDLGEIEEFTNSAIESSQLILRTVDYLDNTVLSTFKLNGLTASLKKLECSGF